MDYKARARRCWELMDKNEHACVRFGMSPLWTTQENFGGKVRNESWPALETGDDHRLAAVALCEVANEIGGGMVV